MGMYDDLRCEMDLPGDVKPNGPNFQTKDFDCMLDQLVITKEGKLMRGDEAIPYHGMITFYTFDHKKRWFEYLAKFTDGICVNITLEEYEEKE